MSVVICLVSGRAGDANAGRGVVVVLKRGAGAPHDSSVYAAEDLGKEKLEFKKYFTSVLEIRIRRIRMFLSLPDPATDPIVRCAAEDLGEREIKIQCCGSGSRIRCLFDS
jgi:hypothetical protein